MGEFRFGTERLYVDGAARCRPFLETGQLGIAIGMQQRAQHTRPPAQRGGQGAVTNARQTHPDVFIFPHGRSERAGQRRADSFGFSGGDPQPVVDERPHEQFVSQGSGDGIARDAAYQDVLDVADDEGVAGADGHSVHLHFAQFTDAAGAVITTAGGGTGQQ